MGIGNVAKLVLGNDYNQLITPHGDWKPACSRGDRKREAELITPHGDWKPPAILGIRLEVTALITPHGDWKLFGHGDLGAGICRSLPLMGIGNQLADTSQPEGSGAHYPSWGLET